MRFYHETDTKDQKGRRRQVIAVARTDEFIGCLSKNRAYIPCLDVYSKIDQVNNEEVDRLARQPNSVVVSCNETLNLDYLLEKILENLSLIKIYTKKRGKPSDFDDCLTMRLNATIEYVCHSIHRTLAEQFKYVLVQDLSTKYLPQRVGIIN